MVGCLSFCESVGQRMVEVWGAVDVHLMVAEKLGEKNGQGPSVPFKDFPMRLHFLLLIDSTFS